MMLLLLLLNILLDLSKIIDCPGQSVSFSVSVDLHDLQYGQCFPVDEPVKVEAAGKILYCRHYRDGVLMPGGVLVVRYEENGQVWLTGDAQTDFEGKIQI